MSIIHIKRIKRPKYTVGLLYTDTEFECFTIELPYLDNKPYVSCYSDGVYKYVTRFSPSLKGNVIWLQNVLNRKWIYIHWANYIHQLRGCTAVGKSIVDLNKDGIPDVTNSRETFDRLMSNITSTGKIIVSS